MPRRRPAPATPPPDETTPPPPSTDAAADSSPPTAWSPRDILIPYVLLAVSLQRAHGYLIEEYLRSVGFLSLEMSTLYRTLRQLEKDGLLHSSWEPGPTGPARRVYSLTEVGRGWPRQWSNTPDGDRPMLGRVFDP